MNQRVRARTGAISHTLHDMPTTTSRSDLMGSRKTRNYDSIADEDDTEMDATSFFSSRSSKRSYDSSRSHTSLATSTSSSITKKNVKIVAHGTKPATVYSPEKIHREKQKLARSLKHVTATGFCDCPVHNHGHQEWLFRPEVETPKEFWDLGPTLDGLFAIKLDKDSSDRRGRTLLEAGSTGFLGLGLENLWGADKNIDRDFLVRFVKGRGGIRARMEGPEPVEAVVQEVQGGQWSIHYTLRALGSYLLHVCMGDTPIPHSPFHVECSFAKPDPKTWRAVGMGLWSGKVATEFKFQVSGHDVCGNYMSIGGHPPEVKLTGPSDVPLHFEDRENGEYHYAYTPVVRGDYHITVKVRGEHVSGSPFLVTVQEADPHYYNCLAQGPGLHSGVVGFPQGFVVSLYDRFKNKVRVGGASVVVTMKNRKHSVDCLVMDLGNGMYDVAYTCFHVGKYIIDVLVDGERIPDAPFRCVIQTGVTHAHYCEMSIPSRSKLAHEGLQIATTVGTKCSFLIYARDRFANQVIHGGDEFIVEIFGVYSVPVTVTDLNSGTYKVEFVIMEIGEYTLSVWLCGEHIKDSPVKVTVDYAPVDAAKCRLRGDGLSQAWSGVEARFRLQTRDVFDKVIDKGGLAIEASFVGMKPPLVHLRDEGDGTYTGTYTPSLRGLLTLHVLLEGKNMGKAPYKVLVHPGNPDALACQVFGDGLHNAVAGVPGNFKLEARDELGNVITIGGADFDVILLLVSTKPPKKAEAAPPSHYDDDWEPFVIDYNVLWYYEQDLAGVREAARQRRREVLDTVGITPLAGRRKLAVLAEGGAGGGGGGGGEGTTAGGEGSQRTNDSDATEDTEFRPKRLSRRKSDYSENDLESISIQGRVFDQNNGVYFMEYLCYVSGTYLLAVRHQNQHVGESPMVLTVHPAALYPMSCYVKKSTVMEVCPAGSDVIFIVKARDFYENDLMEGGANLQAAMWLDNPDSHIDVEVSVKDLHNGEYECRYKPLWTGPYVLRVTANDEDIIESPFRIVIEPGKSVAGECFVTGPGLERGTAGVGNVVYIQAKDSYGNDQQHGNDVFEVTLDGPQAINVAPPTYLGSGLHKVEWLVHTAGEYLVAFKLVVGVLDEHKRQKILPLQGSPFPVFIGPAKTSGEMCVAFGPGLNTQPAGVKRDFTIQARDVFENNRTRGGDDFVVSVNGPQQPPPIPEVLDNGDGTYSVSFTLTVQGRYVIYVSLRHAYGSMKDTPIAYSPFSTLVEPGPTSAERSTASGLSLYLCQVNNISVFYLQAMDSYGNVVKKSGDDWHIEITGPLDVNITVTDHDNGRYSVSFVCKALGDYDISIKLGVEELLRSPFKMICDRKVKRKLAQRQEALNRALFEDRGKEEADEEEDDQPQKLYIEDNEGEFMDDDSLFRPFKVLFHGVKEFVRPGTPEGLLPLELALRGGVKPRKPTVKQKLQATVRDVRSLASFEATVRDLKAVALDELDYELEFEFGKATQKTTVHKSLDELTHITEHIRNKQARAAKQEGDVDAELISIAMGGHDQESVKKQYEKKIQRERTQKELQRQKSKAKMLKTESKRKPFTAAPAPPPAPATEEWHTPGQAGPGKAEAQSGAKNGGEEGTKGRSKERGKKDAQRMGSGAGHSADKPATPADGAVPEEDEANQVFWSPELAEANKQNKEEKRRRRSLIAQDAPNDSLGAGELAGDSEP